MIEPELVINENLSNEESIKALTYYNKSVAIYINPVYEWFEENISNISYKLLKGFITNIVPMAEVGKTYFEHIAEKKTGFTDELMALYNNSEKIYIEGNLKIKSYLELKHLGYSGTFLNEKYPIEDVWEYVKQEALRGGIPFSKSL
ncbi:hypothetical protein [Clostridium sp.]